MKTKSKLACLFATLAVAPFAAWGDTISSDLELEPCINGAVSSTGRFPAQAQEDAYMSAIAPETSQTVLRVEASQPSDGVELSY